MHVDDGAVHAVSSSPADFAASTSNSCKCPHMVNCKVDPATAHATVPAWSGQVLHTPSGLATHHCMLIALLVPAWFKALQLDSVGRSGWPKAVCDSPWILQPEATRDMRDSHPLHPAALLNSWCCNYWRTLLGSALICGCNWQRRQADAGCRLSGLSRNKCPAACVPLH